MLMSIKNILFAFMAACLMVTAFANPEANAAPDAMAMPNPDAIASPDHNIEKRKVHIDLNQQRCISHGHGLFATYDIRVGREYTKGHCDALWRNLRNAGANMITMWSCKKLQYGHMRIVFNHSVGYGDALNKALSQTFPHIGRVAPFRCNGRAPYPFA